MDKNEEKIRYIYINNIGTTWPNKIATAYQNEVVNPTPRSCSTPRETEYSAKIELIYASDYGFAASPSAWTTMVAVV